MNIIERAGRHLGSNSPKSRIEQAAERLSAGDQGPSPSHDAPPPTPLSKSAAPVSDSGEARHSITIDFDRLRAKGLVLPGAHSHLAEELRLIKQPLLNAAFSGKPTSAANQNVIMVTSAGPNEGKTFVATNLALSMTSELGVHVLLIDADVVKPSIPTLLGFKADLGMLDILADPTIDFSDVVMRTNIENLAIMPGGRFRPGMTELLASARMADFVAELSRRYANRIIIFDSPPVLARSEPIVLAKHVGQVVFVVEAERTSRTAIEEAIRIIGNDKIAGVILNKAPIVMGQEGFGRGYGYSGYYHR